MPPSTTTEATTTTSTTTTTTTTTESSDYDGEFFYPLLAYPFLSGFSVRVLFVSCGQTTATLKFRANSVADPGRASPRADCATACAIVPITTTRKTVSEVSARALFVRRLTFASRAETRQNRPRPRRPRAQARGAPQRQPLKVERMVLVSSCAPALIVRLSFVCFRLAPVDECEGKARCEDGQCAENVANCPGEFVFRLDVVRN